MNDKDRAMLLQYQEAEAKGYIHRCPKCGSLEASSQIYTEYAGSEDECQFNEYTCTICHSRFY